MTATVSAADGGVHFTEVAMLAVAVSFTEVTEVAPDATGICALRFAGCLSDTELTAQLAVPSPLAQPLVNVGFWLDGWAARADRHVCGRSAVLGRDLHGVGGLLAAA